MSIDMNFIKNILEKHMKDQPYQGTCSECEKDLDYHDTTVDSDMDLNIMVNVCSCATSKIDNFMEFIKENELEESWQEWCSHE